MKKLQFFTMFTVITIIAIVIVIKNYAQDHTPDGKRIMNYEYFWDEILDWNSTNIHVCYIHYGIIHFTGPHG